MDLADILLMVGCLFPNTASHIFVAIMPVVQPRGDHARVSSQGVITLVVQPRADWNMSEASHGVQPREPKI